ncbi:MAG: GAF domain-containing protein [Blastocatellia bacterium]|nr:GAF domain-containing protein [Blastocatellia bacterium]
MAQTFHFKNYTASDGLPSNTVWALHQDRKGYLWFGTDSGLCRYDGLNYTNFGIAHGLGSTSIRGIFEDSRNRLWVATGLGVSVFDGERFTTYTTAQGLPDNQAFAGICTSDGTLWVSTAKGLARFDGQRFTPFQMPVAAPVWVFYQDHAGTLWGGSRGNGLLKIGKDGTQVIGRAQGLPDEFVFGLGEDQDHQLWVATSGGLCRSDGNGFRVYTQADGLGNNLAGSLVIDRYGRVWVCTYGAGLSRLERSGQVTVFNQRNGLTDVYLTGLMQDAEGNIWCATRSNGVFRLSNEAFAAFSKADGMGEGKVAGVGETPDGTVWFASVTGGLTALNPKGEIRRYGVKDGLQEETLWCLAVDAKGNVWTGGGKGVSCFDGKRFRNYSFAEMGARDSITCMTADRQGNVWFGSFPIESTGLIRYDGTTFTCFGKEQGMPHNPANSVTVDQGGTVWVGSEVGLIRFDGTGFRLFTVQDGLPSNRVQCAFGDEGNILWVGTDSGLVRFDGKQFRTYTTAEGLVGNVVRAVTRQDGNVWIGTSRGISIFDGEHFRNFTTRDGLLSDDIASSACLRQQNGTVWFGTNHGALRYRKVPDITVPVAPQVHLTGVQIADRVLQVLQDGEFPNRLPTFPYTDNTLTFEFLATSFTDERSVRYSFFLENFDREWSQPQRERFVRFTNLPAGNYRFWVKAASAASSWGEPKSVEVMIRPPFWQTWWFQIGMVAGLSLMGFGAYTLRIRSLHRLQAERLEHYRQLQQQREAQRLEHLRQMQEQHIEHLQQMQEQRLSALGQLLKSIQVINSDLDLKTVLQNLAEEGAQLVGGGPGGIGLIEGDQVIFKQLWRDGTWQDEQMVFKLGQGVAGKVAQTGRAMIVTDVRNCPEIAFPERLAELQIHGLMDVPVRSRTGTVIGVLDVRQKAGSPSFTEADRELIESLANQAAIALEKAALYGQLAEKNQVIVQSMRELETLYKHEQEFARRVQELDQMKTNFLVVTSHEMRTPLMVLKGYTDCLNDELFGPLNEAQRTSLETCGRMVERMAESCEEILEMLKISEGHSKLLTSPTDLSALVYKVTEELKSFVEQRRQHMQVEIPETLPVAVDAKKIELVLLNVVQNAIKFTPDGGSISIRVNGSPAMLHIAVVDSGIGISPEELDRIFDMFYTNADTSTHTSGKFEFSARGTGLGLAIAKSYVEMHGGRIWAESDGAKSGSTFHIELPRSKPGLRTED